MLQVRSDMKEAGDTVSLSILSGIGSLDSEALPVLLQGQRHKHRCTAWPTPETFADRLQWYTLKDSQVNFSFLYCCVFLRCYHEQTR